MKLQVYDIDKSELQSYCDKYQDKIKFVTYYYRYMSGANSGTKIILIIDEE